MWVPLTVFRQPCKQANSVKSDIEVLIFKKIDNPWNGDAQCLMKHALTSTLATPIRDIVETYLVWLTLRVEIQR
jgi:hypothetical protein